MHAELRFPVFAQDAIPADHGYALFGAVSRCVPSVHGGNGFTLAPIAGRQLGHRTLGLNRNSRLIIRVDANRVGEFLSLAGQRLSLGRSAVMLGPPAMQQLTPASCVRARLVTIKGYFQPEPFLEAVQRQLSSLDVLNATVTLGRRRTMRIKTSEIVGFETILDGLNNAQSLAVLAHGVGGRRHMGCGVFAPIRGEKDVQN